MRWTERIVLTRTVDVTTPTLTHAIAKGTTVRTKPSTITEFSWFPAPRKGDEYEQVAREGERPGPIADHRLVAPMSVIINLALEQEEDGVRSSVVLPRDDKTLTG